jgi:SM-20-related protein
MSMVFRRTDKSWHGHKPFDGKRQAITFNWMNDTAAAKRELRRHAVSAGIETLFYTR